MRTLLILNDAPYGDERIYTAPRLANAVQKHDRSGEVTVFLMANAVTPAKSNQSVPKGYHNTDTC